jgi:hypothetical protein
LPPSPHGSIAAEPLARAGLRSTKDGTNDGHDAFRSLHSRGEPMKPDKNQPRKRATSTEVRRELDRLMYEKGWEQASEIDWEDEDLAALRRTLSEDEFQTLLDEIDPLGGQER